jgi:hypothetical protein
MHSVPGSFWEWLAQLNTEERTGVIMISISAIAFIITVIICTMYAMHKNRLQDALKRELLDRGMTAEEIATVVRAHPQRGCSIDSSSGEIS